jgi:hypothetical protein
MSQKFLLRNWQQEFVSSPTQNDQDIKEGDGGGGREIYEEYEKKK